MTVPNPDFDRVGAEEKQRDHRLEAEEAATAYWRSVAADRRVEAARVQKRPLVRAAIAIDRRTKAFQDRLGGAARTVLGHARNIAARADPGLGRPPSTVQETSLGPVGPNVEVFVIDGDSPEPGRTIVERGAVDDAISASTAEIVVLVAPGVRIGASDVAALVDAVDRPDVVAAVPTSLHPDDRRSAHAGAVRSAGGRLTLVGSTPVSEPIPSSGSTSTVDIAIGGAVAMRRDELVDAGGLGPLTDVTTAIVDLALRDPSLQEVARRAADRPADLHLVGPT